MIYIKHFNLINAETKAKSRPPYTPHRKGRSLYTGTNGHEEVYAPPLGAFIYTHITAPLGDAKSNEKANPKKALPDFIFCIFLAEILFKKPTAAS